MELRGKKQKREREVIPRDLIPALAQKDEKI